MTGTALAIDDCRLGFPLPDDRTMDLLTTAFLVGAGVVAGIMAAIVGGAAVVVYPALIAAGVPPQLAAVVQPASR